MQSKFRSVRSHLLQPVYLLLAAFVTLGFAYSIVTPLFEGPDENGHYAYVRYLAAGYGLPIQSFDRSQVVVGEGHQPPLYYAVAALLTFWIDVSNEAAVYRPNPAFVWLGRGQEPNVALHTAAEQFPFRGVALLMHIARAVSVLFGAITVWATYRLGRLVGGSQAIALGAAAVVAFNPQFLFISGVVNNDSALIAFASLALLALAAILIEGGTRKRAVWTGVWIALALLSKTSALFLGPLVLIVASMVAVRERSWRSAANLTLWIAIPVVLIAGWWFVRNQVLYGDPLGYQMFIASHPSFSGMDFGQADTWRQYFNVMHRSFWGQFGWMVIRLEPTLYAWLEAVYPVAALGALTGYLWRREVHARSREAPQPGWLFSVLIVVLMMAWSVNYTRILGGFGLQGRYLFPAISAIAVLIVGGLSSLVPDRLRWIPAGVLSGSLAVLAISAPGQYIAPTYRFFTLPESALADVPRRLSGTFSPEIALAGYRVEAQASDIDLTLYWLAHGTPPVDYKVFIHALNSEGQLCGQRDALPQDGAFLMTFWRPGDVIEDVHRVPIGASCCTNDACRLRIGLYREDTGERLLYSLNGQPVSDYVEIRP